MINCCSVLFVIDLKYVRLATMAYMWPENVEHVAKIALTYFGSVLKSKSNIHDDRHDVLVMLVISFHSRYFRANTNQPKLIFKWPSSKIHAIQDIN